MNTTLSSQNLLVISGLDLDDVAVQAAVTHIDFDTSLFATANTAVPMTTGPAHGATRGACR